MIDPEYRDIHDDEDRNRTEQQTAKICPFLLMFTIYKPFRMVARVDTLEILTEITRGDGRSSSC